MKLLCILCLLCVFTRASINKVVTVGLVEKTKSGFVRKCILGLKHVTICDATVQPEFDLSMGKRISFLVTSLLYEVNGGMIPKTTIVRNKSGMSQLIMSVVGWVGKSSGKLQRTPLKLQTDN
ncbi:MAG: hypothetical protein DMG97_18755, partial [Acidobacteria bacterium]